MRQASARTRGRGGGAKLNAGSAGSVLAAVLAAVLLLVQVVLQVCRGAVLRARGQGAGARSSRGGAAEQGKAAPGAACRWGHRTTKWSKSW